MTPEDLESCAWAFLNEARLGHMFAPLPTTVLRGHGIHIAEDVPEGTEGWADYARHVAHVAPSRDFWEVQRRVAHEGDHFALHAWGVPKDRHHLHTDHLSLFWRVPQASLLKLVRRHGRLFPGRTIAAFPGLSPTSVLLRAGYAVELAVVVHTPSGRFASSAHWRELDLGQPFPFERSLVKQVLERDERVDLDDGLSAWPYREGRSRCVVILLELESLAKVG